jgi:hypothetical protein
MCSLSKARSAKAREMTMRIAQNNSESSRSQKTNVLLQLLD